MKLRKFDIILCKNSESIISKIIRFFTKDEYSHSELYIGDNHIVDTLYPKGVTIRHIDRKLGDFDIYRYNAIISEKQKELIEEFIQRKLNVKYDLIELFFQIFNLENGDKNKYICISLITEAFEYAGINLGEWKKGFKQITESKHFVKIKNIKNNYKA